ncbi:hypothetical protein [Demequina sp.]|uniref:hypothetical protein n=1 Tax=Demequina sp. TaxID=2050685 RepID=UPI003A8498CA
MSTTTRLLRRPRQGSAVRWGVLVALLVTAIFACAGASHLSATTASAQPASHHADAVVATSAHAPAAAVSGAFAATPAGAADCATCADHSEAAAACLMIVVTVVAMVGLRLDAMRLQTQPMARLAEPVARLRRALTAPSLTTLCICRT